MGLDDVVVIITATDENDAPKLTGRVELSIDENADVNAFAGNTETYPAGDRGCYRWYGDPDSTDY